MVEGKQNSMGEKKSTVTLWSIFLKPKGLIRLDVTAPCLLTLFFVWVDRGFMLAKVRTDDIFLGKSKSSDVLLTLKAAAE